MAIERGEDMMMLFDEAPVLNDEQHNILAMALYDSLNDIYNAQDLQEANARKTKMGEEASEANMAVLHDEIENFSGAMNDADTPEALPEAPNSPAINHNADWAGLFYEGEEDTIAEDQESFIEHETSSTDPTASPQTPSESMGIAPESLDHCMITEGDDENVVEALQPYVGIKDAPKTPEEEFEDAWKQFEEGLGESKTHDETYPRLKTSIRTLDESWFLDSPPLTPSASPTGDIQNSLQQVEQPVHQVKQQIHQVEQTVRQVQPTRQAQPLHAEEQTVLPALLVTKRAPRMLSRTASVGSLTLPAVAISDPLPPNNPYIERHVHQMQPAHATKLPPGQLHLPMYHPQQASQIRQPGLNFPQHNPDLQQGTKSAQGRAKKAARLSKTVSKSAPTTMFIDAQDIENSQALQEVVADFQYHGEPEMTDGVQAHESNEYSYVVTEGQSEQGLAGLFGLTLDQAKSGMRNKKAGIRNTMIEKPKVCLP